MSIKVLSKNAPGDRGGLLRPSHPRILIARVVSLILIVALTGSPSVNRAQAQTPNEYQIKAAFLYNFAKFVEWPADAFGESNASIIVGVVGEDPFGSALDQIKGKTINGRPIGILRLKWDQNLRACHILFISSSELKRLGPILESLRGSSVLTIGEMAHFNENGGIINLLMEENKVRFAINSQAAVRARLKISSKLLALAKSVIGRS